ncbi:MAG: gliding motility protein GldN [Bacteroidales bacterium]
MKKTGVIVIALLVLAGSQLPAQTLGTANTTDPASWSGIDLVYKKEHVFDKKPIAYPPVREADIIWSKVVWRMVDLREKINQPLYFPTDPIGERMSLVDVLLHAVREGGLTAYSADDDLNEFKQPISYAQVVAEFDAKDQVTDVIDVETGFTRTDTIRGEIRKHEVQQLLVKEMWFFDRKRSVLDVRIIGVCPIRLFFKEEDVNRETLLRKKLFWVKYPEARPFLAQREVYNFYNDAEMRTYDEIFYKRFFKGFVVQETNVYNNRMIEDYALGLETLLEAERIENLIFKFENDLWEY